MSGARLRSPANSRAGIDLAGAAQSNPELVLGLQVAISGVGAASSSWIDTLTEIRAVLPVSTARFDKQFEWARTQR